MARPRKPPRAVQLKLGNTQAPPTLPRFEYENKVDAWRLEAACRSLPAEVFFSGFDSDIEEAKKYCAVCPVRQQCTDYALMARETHGIWGGYTEKELRRLRRQRAKGLRQNGVSGML